MTTPVLLPTTREASILTALRDDPATKVPSKTLFRLWEHGWVDPDSGNVTPLGVDDSEDRIALDVYRKAEGLEAKTVRVAKRLRGRSPIRGLGRVPDGRNVYCMACFRAGGDSVVWFTNNGGAVATRAAEIAAGKHLLAHRVGTLPPILEREA